MATFSVTFNEERNYVHVKFFGELSANIIRDAFISAQPFLDSKPDAITDFSEASLRLFTTENVTSLVSGLSGRVDRHGIRSALVAPDDLEFGLIRMFDAYANKDVPQERMVFRTIEDALDWIAERE